MQVDGDSVILLYLSILARGHTLFVGGVDDTSAWNLWTWVFYSLLSSISWPGNWGNFQHFILPCTLYIDTLCGGGLCIAIFVT